MKSLGQELSPNEEQQVRASTALLLDLNMSKSKMPGNCAMENQTIMKKKLVEAK
jgi:hypothetical protein